MSDNSRIRKHEVPVCVVSMMVSIHDQLNWVGSKGFNGIDIAAVAAFCRCRIDANSFSFSDYQTHVVNEPCSIWLNIAEHVLSYLS